GGFILGSDVHNTVGINIEGDFNLRDSSGGRRNAGEIELTEEFVINDHFSFTLEHSDADSCLVIGSSRVGLGLLGGHGGVSGDHLGEDSAQSLNTEREGSDVQKKQILNVSLQDTSLNGGTNSDSL